MNRYNFDEIVNRKNTSSYKWDIKENELPMWVADMDFHVLPEIRRAIEERNKVDAYGYAKCPDDYLSHTLSGGIINTTQMYYPVI